MAEDIRLVRKNADRTTPEPCPKCGGMMYWIIINQLAPGTALTSENKHMVTSGYTCRGKNDFGCGYNETYDPETKMLKENVF